MLRTFRVYSLMALALLLAASLSVACGGEECTTNGDCKDKGANYICKLDLATSKRSCELKKTTQPTCPTTCDNNSDCADCEDGKVRCIGRICSKPPSTCPDSCGSDDDCKDCEEGKTSCQSGACVKPAACPNSCTQDNDCAGCADGNNLCISGTCSKQTSCPAVCAVDNDCAGCETDRQTCTNGTCGDAKTCPATCTTSDDCSGCAAGNTFCNNGSCGQPPVQCPTSCQADVDCTNCPAGLTSCVNGQCSPKQQPTCPATCSADGDCATCTDGKTSCVQGFCQKPLCPTTCTANTDCANCPNRTSCQNGKCAATSCPTSCGSDAECASGCGTKTKCVAGLCEDPNTFCGRCGTDADCSIPGCGGTKTKCVAGQCTDGNTCPSFCRNDTECALPGCGNKQQCVNNQCINNTCPASCTQDNDCLAPACGNRTTCNNGVCGAAPTCPATCTSSTQCNVAACGTRTTCQSGSCQAPGQCPALCFSSASCAPCGTGYTCDLSSFTCKQASSCPSSCIVNSQCAPCGSGYTCQSGLCRQGTTSGPAGRRCSTTSTCPSGYRCITIGSSSTNSFCFQECTSATTCASNTTDGRTQCIAFASDSQGNNISVCMGRNAKGQKCGDSTYSTSSQALCQLRQTPPLYCSNTGTCTAVTVQTTVGATCNKSTDNTEPIRQCDGTKGLACSESTGKCVTATVAKEGEACDPTGAGLGKQVICDTKTDPDLLCVSFSSRGDNSACHKLCDPAKANQCSHKPGTTCFQAFSDGMGICLDLTCTTDADCLYTNYECTTLSSGGNACFPKPSSGPKKIGEVCGTPISTKGCGTGLQCLSLQGAADGFCSQTCTSTCPRMGGKTGSCITVGSNKFCFVRCVTNSSCPTGLKCTSVNFGSGSTADVCFP